MDQNKVIGIDSVDENLKEEIYDQYIQAYKKGVFDYIKEDYDRLTKSVIPRKYFSGGFRDSDLIMDRTQDLASSSVSVGENFLVRTNIDPMSKDNQKPDEMSRRDFLRKSLL